MLKDLFASHKKSIRVSVPTVDINSQKSATRLRTSHKDMRHAQSLDGAWNMEDMGGSLAVDIWETEDALVVHSTMAGVTPNDVHIGLSGDLLTIRGERHHQRSLSKKATPFYQECYWGSFSRSIILPVAVEESKVRAELAHGILEIVLPKKMQPKTETIIKVKST